jgi:hypothetical protein
MSRVIDAIGLHRKKKLSCAEAGEGMSERHFRRLRDAYEAHGAEGIILRQAQILWGCDGRLGLTSAACSRAGDGSEEKKEWHVPVPARPPLSGRLTRSSWFSN